MPGENIGYLPAMSRLIGEVDSPTPNQPLMSPQFGGSPEQLMSMMQSPHMQEALRQWGVNFDPSQMRQSPFLPNAFMQQHPTMGGMLNRGMAGAAATPEAPLVSGAGSGITRAMQGAMGGPELLRQYQIRQMLAPMQMIGQQMPMAEFQRKQQLLGILGQDLSSREALAQSAQQLRSQESLERGRQANAKITATRPFLGPDGQLYTYSEGQPQGGPEGTSFQPQPEQGGARQMMDPRTGQMATVPNWGLTPAIAPGWGTTAPQPTMEGTEDFTKRQHPERQGTADLRKTQVTTEQAKQEELRARAERERAQAQSPGGRYGAADRERWAKDYNDVEARVTAEKNKIDQLVAGKGLTPEQGAQQKAAWDNYLSRAKENYDRQMGKSGQSSREAGTAKGGSSKGSTNLPKQIAPGAQVNTPATGQSSSGLPSGYEFNDQGIPVPIQPHQ